MSRTVAGVYDRLPAKQHSEACIFTGDYGEASALNILGKNYGLPPAICGHNSYYLWGPDGCSGKTIITVGVGRGDVSKGYSQVVQAATTRCHYCASEEDDLPIYVATKPKAPLPTLWPGTKHFD